MAEEIDHYLQEKLNDAIDGTKDTTFLSKIAHLHEHFDRLKTPQQNPNSPNPQIKAEEWSKISRENLYYLNNLLTEWQMLSKKWGLLTPEAIAFAYNLNKKLSKIRKDLKGGDSSATTHLPPSETYRWSSRFVDPDKVHGLDAKAMSLERMLVGRESHDPFKAIGIIGMAGIGKTTLAQLIFSWPKVKDDFLPRIWVCMSKQPNQDIDDKKEIVKRILRSLGIEEEIIMMTDQRRKLRGLIFLLRAQLMDKRYLIVLDDLEKTYGKLDSGSSVNGEELSYGLPKGCGGTVIVTSRHEKVAKEMVGEENLHTLMPLSDPESCWLIFKDWVQKDKTEFPSYLENLKEEIMKKCGGLPLSAKMMGQIVNERLNLKEQQTKNQQEEEQPQPENHQLTEQPQMENQQPPEQPQKENQLPMEQPQMENQPQLEQLQTENQQLSEQLRAEKQQPREENQQPTEQPHAENHQPAEQPHTENQQLTEQPHEENQQPMEQPQTENQQQSEQPQTENQQQSEQPHAENQQPPEQPKKENQKPTEQPQTENQRLSEQPHTENQQPMEQPQTENQQQPKKENQQPTEQPQKENQQPTEQQQKENQRLSEQPHAENQQPMEQPQTENQQQSEQLQMENQQLTEQPHAENQPPPEQPHAENQQPPEQLKKENQQPTEQPQTENQRLSEQPHTENQEPSEQPHTENQQPWEELRTENQQPSEEPQTENQKLTEQPQQT